ncbi:hypothetical protein B0T21DRAFT_421655 [Apiosordaria backusii]|uniref:Uncharacterized protein n=1 Tax=Apiosordaria backusii TaxID=314023 RepID=A0AA40E6Y7_9PEZI|nr:hypothetical protein B0T21DRAFT_421655 [Apiosordaria backusii]
MRRSIGSFSGGPYGAGGARPDLLLRPILIHGGVFLRIPYHELEVALLFTSEDPGLDPTGKLHMSSTYDDGVERNREFSSSCSSRSFRLTFDKFVSPDTDILFKADVRCRSHIPNQGFHHCASPHEFFFNVGIVEGEDVVFPPADQVRFGIGGSGHERWEQAENALFGEWIGVGGVRWELVWIVCLGLAAGGVKVGLLGSLSLLRSRRLVGSGSSGRGISDGKEIHVGRGLSFEAWGRSLLVEGSVEGSVSVASGSF